VREGGQYRLRTLAYAYRIAEGPTFDDQCLFRWEYNAREHKQRPEVLLFRSSTGAQLLQSNALGGNAPFILALRAARERPVDLVQHRRVLMSSFYVISPMCSHRVPVHPTELGDALVVGRQSANHTFWIATQRAFVMGTKQTDR